MRRSAAAVVLGLALLAPVGARSESAPDVGRPFVPTPVSQPLYGIGRPTDTNGQRHFVTAEDGIPLFVQVWLPRAKPGGPAPPPRVPIVLSVTPYDRPGWTGFTNARARDWLVPRGYGFAVSHVRGTGSSGGCIQFRAQIEDRDSARVVEWLGRDAPWSDGNIAMYGLSYFGATAVGVVAQDDPDGTKYVKAVVAIAPASSAYEQFAMDGVKKFLYHEISVTADGLPGVGAQVGTLNPAYLPRRHDCNIGRIPAGFDQSGNVTPYWVERDDRVGVRHVRAAVLMVHGHADANVFPDVQVGLFDQIPSATPKHGIFGVFGHEDAGTRELSGIEPAWARGDYFDLVTAWLDRYMKGLDTRVEEWPVAEVQGNDGQWRGEREWPTTGGPVGQLALGPSGTLGAATPAGASGYTEGLFETTATGLPPGTFASFETGPLPERLEITGQPVLDLWVRLNKPDAHIAARLETFGPDGARLGERGFQHHDGIPWDTGATFGLRSAQHLQPLVDNRFAQAEAIPAPVGVPMRVQVRMQPTDLVIPKGGRVRITIAGSLMVRYGLETVARGRFGVPVPSVVEDPSQPSGTFTAVTILHDCERPSALRFLMPRANPDLLNVREEDEPPEQPLADNRPFVAPVSDAGGLATAPVCGQAPIRLENFGPEIPYEPPS